MQVEVEVAKARLTEAHADLNYEQTLRGHHVLTAPFDAVVVERHKSAVRVPTWGATHRTRMGPRTKPAPNTSAK